MKTIAVLPLLVLALTGCGSSSGASGDPVSVFVAPFVDLTESGGVAAQLRYAVNDRVRTSPRLTPAESIELADLVIRATVESAGELHQPGEPTVTVMSTDFTVEDNGGKIVVGPALLLESRPEGLRAALERTSLRILTGVTLYLESR